MHDHHNPGALDALHASPWTMQYMASACPNAPHYQYACTSNEAVHLRLLPCTCLHNG